MAKIERLFIFCAKNSLTDQAIDKPSKVEVPRPISSNKTNDFSVALFRIKAVLRAKNTKYVLMNLPNTKIEQVSQILPVLKSPTILPLAKDGWSSLHTVIDEAKFWDVIDELKSAGAEGILIVPIDKMVL